MKKVLEKVAVYSVVFFIYVFQFIGFIFYGVAVLMIPVAIADHFFTIEFKLLVKSVCTLAVFLAVILFYANWKFEKGQEKGFPEKFRDFILYFNFVAFLILIAIKLIEDNVFINHIRRVFHCSFYKIRVYGFLHGVSMIFRAEIIDF